MCTRQIKYIYAQLGTQLVFENERRRNRYIYRSGVNMCKYFIIHIYMSTYTHGVYVQEIEERVDR